MPQAADIIVKDGSDANKTFSLVSPAAGDGGVAQWWLKEGNVVGAFPMLTASATPSQDRKKNSRNLKVKVTVPSSYVDATTGLTIVGPRVEANLTVTVPGEYPEAKKADAVAFVCNLIGSTALRGAMRDALPLT